MIEDGSGNPTARSVVVDLPNYGTLVIDSANGSFSHTLTCERRDDCLVYAVETSDPDLVVVDPCDGRIVIPANENEPVNIRIGTLSSCGFVKESAAVGIAVERLLEEHRDWIGTQGEELARGIEALLTEFVSSAGIGREEYENSVESQRNRAAIASELLRAATMYIVEIKDVRDQFRLLAELASLGDPPNSTGSRGAVLALGAAIGEYNEAFGSLKPLQDAVISDVRAYWEPDRAESVVQIVNLFYEEALTVIHEGTILTMFDDYLTVQLVHMGPVPTKEKIDDAVRNIGGAAARLDVSIAVLETRYNRLREVMQDV